MLPGVDGAFGNFSVRRGAHTGFHVVGAAHDPARSWRFPVWRHWKSKTDDRIVELRRNNVSGDNVSAHRVESW